MKKIIFLLVAGVLFAGCVTLEQTNVDWIPIGPDFPPTKVENLEVISGRQDVKRPYGNLGLLRIRNLKPTRDALRMGIQKGKRIAASKGADAVQIGEYNSAEDGSTDPHITLIIYAIKYVDNLTDADKQAIKDFEELGMLNERTNR